ncbi:MAG: DUF2735 domain-containing protein [Rhodopseudomonas sp.]|nr:DUF2735 domain-containing protein [Rhodopseudomonas sp.]
MTTNHHRESAIIYQFPVGGRAAYRRQDGAKPASSLTQAAFDDIVVGGSWYHEEAVREAEQPRKN